VGGNPSIEFEEDTRLMARAQEGDRQAYARLYEEYAPLVGTYIAAHYERPESYEDLVQEVFTRVWEQRDRYRPGMPVCPYLLGFAQNVIREVQIRECRESRILPPARGRAAESRNKEPPDTVGRRELAECVRSCLAKLPPRQRQAVELVYLAQKSAAEAAEIMCCSQDALRHSLYEARRRLQQSLFHERAEPGSL
jgi:RNA polymerase sigma-70 factor (ECF subfamily)